MMNPLLSIIIPTKDRYNTLGVVVNGLLPYLSSRIEIIIQDNSMCNNKYESLHINSDIVRYFYEKSPIPISDNTTLAIEHSRGKYLLFIGDDDFVSPYIEKILDIINDSNLDCLTFDAGHYWWKTVDFIKPNYYEDKKVLTVGKNISFEISILDTKKQLKKVLKRGAIDYSGLPCFYHGIIKKEILEQIKMKSGKYLIGSCPDMSFAVSLSLILKSHAHMNYPITVFGASKGSGGGMTASKQHFRKIEDATFLRSDIVNKWDPNIPNIWSQKTIYPQTTFEVLQVFNTDLSINYMAFYTSMLVDEFYLFSYLWKKMKGCITNPLFYYQLFRKSVGRIWVSIQIWMRLKPLIVYKKVDSNDVYSFLYKLNIL